MQDAQKFVIILKEGDRMGKYEKGKIVTGSVTGIEKYGIFVSLDEFYSGLIHISEISNGFVRNINDYVNVGETILVKILEIDEEHSHLKLSIKNLNYRVSLKVRQTIVEVGKGFLPLQENLDRWIDEKMGEIRIHESEKK